MRLLLSFMSCAVLASMTANTMLIEVSMKCMLISEVTSEKMNRNITPHSCNILLNNTRTNVGKGAGELEWSKEMQWLISSMFLSGFAISSLPAGFIADNWNGRKCLAFYHILMATGTSLVPLAASYLDVYIVAVLQFVSGVGAGVTIPCVMTMWRSWFPPHQRATLSAIAFTGIPLGAIGISSLAEVTCFHHPARGWTLNFYLIGLVTAIQAGVWWLILRDRPSQAWWINKKEIQYIDLSLEHEASLFEVGRKLKLPWCDVLRSQAVWGLFIGHITADLALYLLIYAIPLYMRVDYGFDYRYIQHDYFSEVPYLSLIVFLLLGGFVADKLTMRCLSLGVQRALYQIIGLLGISSLSLAMLMQSCESWAAIIIMLAAAMALCGLLFSGHMINHIDIAPRHCGILVGMTSFLSTCVVLSSHVAIKTAVENGGELRVVVISITAVLVVGAFVYPCLMSGDIQQWAVSVPYMDEEDLAALLSKHDMGPIGTHKLASQKTSSGPCASDNSCSYKNSFPSVSPPASSQCDHSDGDYPHPKSIMGGTVENYWWDKEEHQVWERKKATTPIFEDSRVVRASIYSDSGMEVDRSPRAEAAGRSPCAEVATRSPQAEAAGRSPRAEVATRSPQAEAAGRSPRADAAEGSPCADVTERSPRTEALSHSWSVGKGDTVDGSIPDEYPPQPPPITVHNQPELSTSVNSSPMPLITIETLSSQSTDSSSQDYSNSTTENVGEGNDNCEVSSSPQHRLTPNYSAPSSPVKDRVNAMARAKKDRVRFKMQRYHVHDHVQDEISDDRDEAINYNKGLDDYEIGRQGVNKGDCDNDEGQGGCRRYDLDFSACEDDYSEGHSKSRGHVKGGEGNCLSAESLNLSLVEAVNGSFGSLPDEDNSTQV